MSERRGLLKAELSAPDQHPGLLSNDILTLINDRIEPPSPVTAQDVYFRSMFIVSDQINSYGGKFPREEFGKLVELLVDSPVLIGHRRDSLPVGRTFHAVSLERDGQFWIKSSFYWLKAGDGAESLRENIDGGVYKECSIGFAFLTPECSICGEDIRQCRHVPLETYIINDREDLCHFTYRHIQKVLETSLVYRGATPDTSISKELIIAKTDAGLDDIAESYSNLDALSDHDVYLLVPSYEGIDLSIKLREGAAMGWRRDGRKVDLRPFGVLKADADAAGVVWQARLVGFRGKERYSRANLEKYLKSETGPVSRLVLFLFPHASGTQLTSVEASYHRVQPIRHRKACRAEIASVARTMTTKRGVEILCPSDMGVAMQSFL